MMKLVSFVVFTVGLIWTWFLFNSKPTIGVDVHAGLQSKLAIFIENSIKATRPGAYDFRMISLYTKAVDENKINAFYSYQYSEKLEGSEDSDQSIKGEAVLNRSLSENSDEPKWVVQSVKTNNATVEFHEGSVINTGDSAENTESADSAAAAPEGTQPTTTEPAPNAPTTAPESVEKKTE